MELSNISCLITGGASGLGAATAARLAKGRAKITLADLDETRGPELADALGGQFVKTDVTDPESVSAALDAADAHAGPVRVLINCAGVVGVGKTVGRGEPHDLDAFKRVININLIGTFNCIRLAAARMTALAPIGEERGVIVNTASVAAFDGQIGQASYSASKAGVAGMTLPIARDLARDGIRVVTLAPGIFDTAMMASLSEEVRQSLGASVPFPQRLGDPDEFASLVEHVCTNGYLNGEVIRLDGAIRMAPK